jgi:murein tripeptide amidase MpaA
LDWTNFQKLEDIHGWLRSLASQRPADISTFVAGISYEGREILGLKINIGNVVGKKSIFFEANIHANEWIGGSTQTFIINELLTSTDTNVRDLLNQFEWWFIPILNVGE